jgi:hypothetical protein
MASTQALNTRAMVLMLQAAAVAALLSEVAVSMVRGGAGGWG